MDQISKKQERVAKGFQAFQLPSLLADDFGELQSIGQSVRQVAKNIARR